MIPKLYAKENGYPNAFNGNMLGGMPMPNGMNGMGNPINAGFLPSYIPENVVVHANGEMDSILQNHRRKMLRRAANRRSAQLSRARKKNFMEDLKVENIRLQKMVDILDSQPDLVFSVTSEGQITYISERTKLYVKTDESSDDDPSHMNQILTTESMVIFQEALNQVKQSFNSNISGPDYSRTSAVMEVCFHDSNGYPTVGYLRCSKAIRKPAYDELQDSKDMNNFDNMNNGNTNGSESVNGNNSTNMAPPNKKSKKSVSGSDDGRGSNNNFASSSSSSSLNNMNMGGGGVSVTDSALAGAMALQALQMCQQRQQQQSISSFNPYVLEASSPFILPPPVLQPTATLLPLPPAVTSSTGSLSTNSHSSSSGGQKHNSSGHGKSKYNSGNSDSNTSEDSNTKTDSLNELTATSGSGSGSDSHNNSSNNNNNNSNHATQNQGGVEQDYEEEFVCVIRPADASIPQGASVMYQTYLSTASMVEHDRKRGSDRGSVTDANGRLSSHHHHRHGHHNHHDNSCSSNNNANSLSNSGCDSGSNGSGSGSNSSRGRSSGSPSGSLSNDNDTNDSGSDDKFSSGQSNNNGDNLTGNGGGTSSETGSDECDSA